MGSSAHRRAGYSSLWGRPPRCRPAKQTMPGGETVAEARPRPARRGCRGGWRARQARERGSGDQLTALDTGANGPRRVECHQSPDNDYRRGDRDPPESQRASCLSSAPPPRLDRHRQLNDRLDASYPYIYDRQQLLAVRHQLDGDASRGVTDILQRNLPAHLIRRHGLSQPCGAEGGDPQTISLGPAQLRLSGRIPAQLPRPTLDQTRRPDNHTGAIKHHIFFIFIFFDPYLICVYHQPKNDGRQVCRSALPCPCELTTLITRELKYKDRYSLTVVHTTPRYFFLQDSPPP